MKKQMVILIVLVIGTCFFSASAFAGKWILYDNFNSGKINKKLWNIDDSSATISVVGGKAKFVSKPGHTRDSSYLSLKEPKGIKGMRATVKVIKSSGDTRARIGAWAGKRGKYYYFHATEIRPMDNYIDGNIRACVKKNGDWTIKYTAFWGHFGEPKKVIKKNFQIGIDFYDLNNIHFTVNQFGNITYDPKEKIKSITKKNEMFMGIGTRYNDDKSFITATFDNVYVYK